MGTNQTDVSAQDSVAKLYTKGGHQTTELNYMGHMLIDLRHELPVDVG